jgi:thioredoxin reductase (NADPH)
MPTNAQQIVSGSLNPMRDIQPSKDDPRYDLAFPKLTDDQITALEEYGKTKTFKKGDILWQAGQIDLCMYVVKSGGLQILEGRSGGIITTHTKGSFSGDIDIITGRASVVTARAEGDLEVLEVPGDCVRSIVSEKPHLGELILRAFLLRRSLLIESQKTGVLVIGSRYCQNTLRIREFLARNLYPVEWEDVETSEDVQKMLQEFGITEDQVPVIVLPSGDVLRAPTTEQVAEALGIKRVVDSTVYDLVIVGAGPAGLAAAVYGASEGLSTMVLDSSGPGGQAGTSSLIENYMGFPLGLTGQQLADGAIIQAEKFGAKLMVPAEVRNITCRPIGGHVIDLGHDKIECRCVILAPGAHYRKLDVEDCDRFDGRGVYYEATYLERMMCGNQNVAVVGGGNSAGQAAVFLADNAARVFLIVRGKDLRSTMSSYLARRIETSPNITTIVNSEVCDVHGEGSLKAITICDLTNGEKRKEAVIGLFILIGATPHTDWLPEQIARDERGYILTGPDAAKQPQWTEERHPFFLETTCPGVFAAGDARANSVKRVASAVGEGSMAVTFVHQHLANMP